MLDNYKSGTPKIEYQPVNSDRRQFYAFWMMCVPKQPPLKLKTAGGRPFSCSLHWQAQCKTFRACALRKADIENIKLM